MKMVKCAGGCGKMVREEGVMCTKIACVEKVFYTPPKPSVSMHKAFAHHKAALVAAVSRVEVKAR